MPCTGSVQVDHRDIDVPGASFTTALGLNDQGDVVGYYRNGRNVHGFKWKNGQFWVMNYPGSRGTVSSKINDGGDVVGYFFDSNGLPHGFVYRNGQWSRIDFPNSMDTVALGINSVGDIVGAYDVSQAVTHAFELRNGRFTRVDAPFGQQAELTGINDLGQQTGFAWDDGTNGPYFGIVGRDDSFSMLNMPTAQFTLLTGLNNNSMIVGYFDGSTEIHSGGLVKIFGNLHVTQTGLNPYIYCYGNNDGNEIAGEFYDFTKARWVGYVGTLPIHTGIH
jgi:probable HAF family extracellular repeat protein